MNFFEYRQRQWSGTATTDGIDYSVHDKHYHHNNYDPARMSCSLRRQMHHLEEEDMHRHHTGGANSPLATKIKTECNKVVAQYSNPDGTKKPGWMKAPNGKPTCLTEDQWIIVRTEAFRKEFGDWLSVAIRKAIGATEEIDFGNTVPTDMKEIVASYKTCEEGDFKKVLEWAKQQVSRINFNKDIGEILTSGHSVRDILRHASRYNRGPLKVLVFKHLDAILQNSVMYGFDNTVKTVKYFLAHRMKFENNPYVVRVTVEETKDGQRTYTVEFSDMRKMKPTDAVATTQEAPSDDSAKSLRPSDTASILKTVLEVKPDAVSISTDENGEPTVSDIEQFLKTNQKD